MPTCAVMTWKQLQSRGRCAFMQRQNLLKPMEIEQIFGDA